MKFSSEIFLYYVIITLLMAYVWLFDIDGVLINITKDPKKDPHLKAYQRDYREVLGVEVPSAFIRNAYGMTHIEMHRYIISKPYIALKLKEQGLLFNDDLSRRLTDAHLPHLMEELQALKYIEPLDGVVKFLTCLQRNNQYIGVVTGNLKEPVDLILKRSGLGGFFSLISCDDGKSTREQILERAIDEASKRKYDFNRVVVIGDTTRDIEAGKYINAFTVAVATGSEDLETLKGKNPDITLQSLNDYREILAVLK